MPKKREEKKPLILSLVNTGTPEHPRFMISDQYLRYWGGSSGWTAQQDQSKAVLFATSNEALQMMNTLMLIRHCDQPKKVFTAPVFIELYSPNPVSVRDLQQWLVRAAKLLIDTPRHGNGPVEQSYGSVRIDLSQLKETT